MRILIALGVVGCTMLGLLVSCVGDATNPPPPDSGAPDVLADVGKDVGKDVGNEDAGVDVAPPPCDLSKPFQAPQPLDSINTAQPEEKIWLSDDELTAYVTTARTDAGLPGFKLYKTTRTTRTDSFGPVALLPVVNAATGGDEGATTTADGLTLMFSSSRPGTLGSFDIFVSTRTSVAVDFAPPAPVSAVNSASIDAFAALSPDGSTLYFGSTRAGGGDLFEANKGSGGWSVNPSPSVAALNDPVAYDGDPVATGDGLTIYFSTSRGDVRDIWMARRTTVKDAFSQVMPVPELNTPGTLDFPNWVSPDGCRIYIGSNRAGTKGGYDVWVAAKP